ncbi:MAG: alcohol dehydrogenase catalytic domain-containing protein, partial [Acidobacteriota bacterium]
MRALILGGAGNLTLRDVASPEAGPGEAVVEVRVAGICRTDLELARGYMAFEGILGHEFVGTVTQVNSPADEVLPGSRVVGEINIGCNECSRCTRGLARHCASRRVLGIQGQDGAFCERLALPAANLHAVPEMLADEEAVFIEPLAASCRILD